ncbi:hypothetical protein Scep_018746 [Stephania cephalantha]|uniref:Uncharacterized protein n=1 Tax=Stephania cephalantha TaxID=152367 RepID=A0AAP0I9Q7_9MAGN
MLANLPKKTKKNLSDHSSVRDGVAGSSSTTSAPISPTGSTAPSNSSETASSPTSLGRGATATTPPSPPCPPTTKDHRPNHAFDLALTPNFVANTLSGTSVYTVGASDYTKDWFYAQVTRSIYVNITNIA